MNYDIALYDNAIRFNVRRYEQKHFKKFKNRRKNILRMIVFDDRNVCLNFKKNFSRQKRSIIIPKRA